MEQLDHKSNSTKITKTKNLITNNKVKSRKDRIVPPLVKHFDELVTSISEQKSFSSIDQIKDKGSITSVNKNADAENVISKNESYDENDDGDYNFEESLRSDLFQKIKVSNIPNNNKELKTHENKDSFTIVNETSKDKKFTTRKESQPINVSSNLS